MKITFFFSKWSNSFLCVLKFRVTERSTPRYLAEETLSKTWLCVVYGVCIRVLVRVTCNTWHLPGLNSMSQWASHCWSLSRSLWRVAESSGPHIVRYTAVSSAKRRTWDCTLSGKSLIYKRNNIGPRTEPCGTPEDTGIWSEHSPSSTTLWLLPIRKDWI